MVGGPSVSRIRPGAYGLLYELMCGRIMAWHEEEEEEEGVGGCWQGAKQGAARGSAGGGAGKSRASAGAGAGASAPSLSDRLLSATLKGDEEEVTALLAGGAPLADPDPPDDDDVSPLLAACLRGQVGVARLLLRAGALDPAVGGRPQDGGQALYLLLKSDRPWAPSLARVLVEEAGVRLGSAGTAVFSQIAAPKPNSQGGGSGKGGTGGVGKGCGSGSNVGSRSRSGVGMNVRDQTTLLQAIMDRACELGQVCLGQGLSPKPL